MSQRSSAPRGEHRTFIGRRRELAELEAAIGDALAGRGRLFVAVGDPGIGKTRLASEAAAAAVRAGARARWARCWEGGGAPPFWPWSTLLRGLARECEADAIAAALAVAGPALAPLVPELCATPAGSHPPATASTPSSDHARFPLFEAAARFLRHIAAARPLLLVIDDLHAADEPSLMLLAFAARELHDAPIVWLATCREPDRQCDPERAALFTAVDRVGQRLPLRGLTVEEVAGLVESVAEATAPATLIAALHRLTEGNPFFLDEIVRLLVAEYGAALPGELTLPLPSSVRAAIRDRLRPLSAEVRRVLSAAAVAGRDIDADVLQAAFSEERDAVLAALGEAGAAGIVIRQVRAAGRYAFTHGLIRDTLYDDLPAGERALWHRRIGTALERVCAGDLEPHLEQLAHHFAHAAAGNCGDGGTAVEYDVRAARRAAERLAFEDAARHYERALCTQRTLPESDGPRALELRLSLAEMQGAAWRLDAARQTFRHAADEARRLEQPAAFARAALGFATLGFGWPRGSVDGEIVAVLEAALALLGERRDALWARVAVRLAVELHFSPELARREALSRMALATARQLGDEATLAYVINARHFAVWESAPLAERCALAGEAIVLGDRLGDAEIGLQGRMWRLLDLAEQGDPVGFDRELESYDQLVERRRLPMYLAFGVAMRGTRALWRGQFEAAVTHAESAVALGQRVGDPTAFATVAIQIFFARRAQGRVAELEAALRGLAEQPQAAPPTVTLLALLYADLDRRDDARREYERLAGDDFAALRRRNVLHPLVLCLAEVCTYLGDYRRGALLYDVLLPFAGGVLGLGPNVLFGPASHGLAILASLIGDWERAAAHFEDALGETRRMQAPAWRAAVEYDYARGLLGHGDRPRAAALAAAAAATAAELGMARLGAAATALGKEASVARVAAASQGPSSGTAGGGAVRNRRVLPFPTTAGRVSPPAPNTAVFRCEGEYWTIAHRGAVMRLRDISGLRYLAELLRNAGREYHALDLAALGKTPGEPAPPTGDESRDGAPLELLDAQARTTYKRQIVWLRDQLDEAQRFNDRERASRLQSEIDFIARELARAVGLRGRNRPAAAQAERARLNVTRAIKSAVRRIAENDRDLGLYLTTTIKTGVFCSYTPDPRLRIEWSF